MHGKKVIQLLQIIVNKTVNFYIFKTKQMNKNEMNFIHL